MTPYPNSLSLSRTRTSCSPCSCLTTSSKNLHQRVRWHQGGECVWKRNTDWKERESLWMCVCVAVFWLASLCLCVCWELWVLRAPRGPLPPPGPPVKFLRATMEFPRLPSSSCRTLVLPQRHKERRQAAGSQAPAHARPPHHQLFYFNFYLLLLLMEELSQPVMAELRGRKFPITLIYDHFSPFFSVMAEIWICESDPASVHVSNKPRLEPLDCSSTGHKNRNESAAILWTRERKTLLKETTLEIRAIPVLQTEVVVFHEELIISHDDVTNIQLCIYRDTPKSACLSAVPSHSQVPHPLCMCVCMCIRKRCHPSYLCKTNGTTPTSIHGILVE